MLKDSRKIAAILAADVVEYSRLMGADEEGTLGALRIRRAVFDELVTEFDGREFGSVGDSLMAEFPSAVNAVLCALAIQQRIESENAPLPTARRMHLRIGVNLGDVIEENGSAFTALMKMEPGARLPKHEHTEVEQSYVIQGSLADDEGTCTGGNFVWRRPGSVHSAWSPDGAVILAIFQKPNKFLE